MIKNTMMDELVQDLVLALEQSSEQSKLGELWEEMVLSPLQQRRQVRRRRAHRRHRDSSLYHYWLEASESSMDEASRGCRRNPASAPVANCSDSDERSTSSRWHRMRRRPLRSRAPSWPHYDSYTENTPGRPLRRRRKVKRVTSDVSSRMPKPRAPHVDPVPALRMQRLSGSKNRPGGWVRAEPPAEGALLVGQERWKRKVSRAEHQDGAEEKMSDGETSSTCSSDPGLFTNDEGRQGDDEQSDWFVEGDCGVRAGVTSLRPRWDSDGQQSLKESGPTPFLHPAQATRRGYCSCLAGAASCSIRKERRRIPTKGGRIPVFVRRLKNVSEERYRRGFWLSSFGSPEQSQLDTLRSPPVRPLDMVSEGPRLRCSASVRTNRQISVNPRIVCTEDVKRRRRKPSSVISACGLSHKEKQ